MPRRIFALVTASVVALATLTLVSPAQAADPPSAGDPDYSFGNGGKLTMSFTNAVGVYDDYANAIAVYPDGRFVVAGAAKGNPLVDNTYQFGVVRFNADGTRDSSFGTDGVVLTNNGLFHDRATAVVIQPDGKIVVSGYCFGDDFFTIRLNQNGSLDSSFGSGGKVTTDFSGQNDQAHGVHLQGDDKIVVTG
ncbi:MAG TPA: delta-60 repeat domain-containing protein, partial [Marmoricola sp.]|nr:delta-60 repeat domain-containing protein [Marmoricola sp.]